jgi:hypothetical protein
MGRTLKEHDLLEAEKKINKLRESVSALESMLDISRDPDRDLPGYQNQSLYRRISTDGTPVESGRDLSDGQRMEIMRLSHQTYGLRGDAHNMVEIVIDFVIGDELAPRAKDPEDKKTQTAIDDIWYDPENKLSITSENHIRSTLLEGELFLIAEMNPIDGRFVLAYLQPELVKHVRKDFNGRDNFIEVEDAQGPTESLKYFVLNSLTEKITVDRTESNVRNQRYQITDTGTSGKTVSCHGLVFSLFLNRPNGATRGRPWTQEVLDYIDIHDELIWAQVEREKLLKLFVIDVEAKDVKNAADATAKLKELGLYKPPTSPISICHNDKVEMKLHAPETSGLPAVQLEQVLRSNIYGAKGLPEHWSGAGSGANFATARAQDVVPLRRLRRIQRKFISFFTQIIRVSMEMRRQKHSLAIDKDPEFDLTYLEVGGRDRQRGAAVLKDLTIALTQAVQDAIITREAANEIYIQAADEGGFTIANENRALPPEPQIDEERLVARQQGVSNSINSGKLKKGKMDNQNRNLDRADRREQRAS